MDDYTKVASVVDLPPGSMITMSRPDLDRVDICLTNIGGKIYAFSSVCTHKGGPLGHGKVEAGYIVCPWHKARFKIEDGKHNWPASKPIRTFNVKVQDDSVYLKRRQ